ncbi:unnamed protein product [Lymnaea stagnalis]|uniref:Microtubule-associated protein futsch n=1 Tax=Lymnaea stagnalis TaxID=6523 RepID=A0AAV2HT75_LYMST
MDSDEHGPITPSSLLLIIGEPFSEEQKLLILSEITKGFRCWDVEDTGININEELAQIANRASLGEEGASGERFIQHQSDNLAVEILINPLAQSVKNSIKKLLIASSPTKYIIYAGHAFQGSGAWVLQDDTFAFNNLAQVFKNVDVENALKQNIEANLTIHTLADTNWGTSISRADFTNHLRIQLNPPEKLDNIHGVLQFTAYVGSFVKVIPITSLLQASEQFGNISFTRPTLYIFPGSQGDSALFGINGFNLLVNGGYNRRACFWDFARHLDRVDAMLMTHLGTDNIFGLNTVLQRKSLENIHPQIGYLYFNALEKVGLSSVGAEGDTPPGKNPSLLINLAEEANKMTQMAKQLGIGPQPCTRNAASVNGEPVNLYHKLGHGSLDMYILNPVADTKELKEFNQAWSKQSANLGTSGLYPLQNALSVCALLVWKPYNLDEKIVRICFPGNAPQHKIIEGLEKMKTFGFLKYASCTSRDLMKPSVVKKPGGTARQVSGSSSTRSNKVTSAGKVETVKVQNTTRLDSPRKTDQRAPAPKSEPRTPASPTKQTKAVKDENNKKNKPKEDVKKSASVNLDKFKSATPRPALSSPVKGMSSPGKSPSPPKAGSPIKSPSPPKVSPIKAPSKAKVPASPDVSSSSSGATGPVAGDQSPAVNHADQQEGKPESDQGQKLPQVEALQAPDNAITESIPEKVQESSVDQISSSVDKVKLNQHDDEQQYHQNGGDNFEGEDEEVKPQALPEPPVIIESPSQESDAIPDYSSKIEYDEQELSEFSRAEEEIQEFERETHSFADPAQEIPSSPEPVPEEQQDQDFDYPAALEPSSGFETPIFAHDEPAVSASQPSMEQNIQYGIDESSSGRDMGGIQEVDEEDQDEESSLTLDSQILNKVDKKEMASTGIFEDEEAGSEGEDDIRENVAQEIGQERVTPEMDNGTDRLSPEGDFEDPEDIAAKLHSEEAVDEGIEDDEQSTVPAAFDKDSSPDYEQGLTGSEERDSIDGDAPDDDKDVDEVAALHVDGVLSENSNINVDSESLKSVEGAVLNPFIGMDNPPEAYPSHLQKELNDNVSDDESFNPVEKWGPPMGLPSPPPVRDRGAASPQKTSAAKPTGTARPARTESAADTKKRPTTAPARGGTGRPASGTKRPGTASSRTSPTNTKIPALPPMTPFYVDLTYIPNHGDPAYSDAEFFKRIRARYYVISSLSPNPQILDSLMEAKATWEQKDLEVTLIPTYDNETLRHWMGLNKEKLQELRIDMTPAVSRCTIQLQDLETSLPAYRLEV